MEPTRTYSVHFIFLASCFTGMFALATPVFADPVADLISGKHEDSPEPIAPEESIKKALYDQIATLAPFHHSIVYLSNPIQFTQASKIPKNAICLVRNLNERPDTGFSIFVRTREILVLYSEYRVLTNEDALKELKRLEAQGQVVYVNEANFVKSAE